MAIQARRGNEADFDASKMLPGEWAVSLDTRYVRMCFSPGIVLRMATYEGFESEKAQIQAILAECKTIQSAVQRIQSEVNSKASLVVEYADSAEKSADRAYSEAERAKTYANNAEAVTGVSIATQDRAGLVKGGDNYIEEDGTLTLIKETTAFTMPNSYSGRLKVVEIVGECQQESTAGNQLFDGMLEQGTYDGSLNKTDSAYRVRSANNIAVNPNETYTISGSVAKNIALYELDTNGGLLSTLSSWGSLPLTFTTSSNGNYIAFALRIDDTTAITPSMVNDVMLNKGTTALPWEPYTNGASPNPSYPQEIKSVKGGIKTHGEQLAKSVYVNETDTTVYRQILFINADFKPNTQYTFSFKGTVGNAYYVNEQMFTPWTTFTIVDGINVITVTTKDDISSQWVENSGYVVFKNQKEQPNPNKFEEVMVVEGNTAKPYQPYTESTIALSTELYGIGDVKDVIEGGKVKRKFAYQRVLGSNITDLRTNEAYAEYGNLIGTNIKGKSSGVSLSNRFIGIIYDDRGKNVNSFRCYLDANTSLIFRVAVSENGKFADIESVRTYFDENEVYAIYELAEEITEDLPLADQIALNSIKTYDGITYLEFDSEIEPTFKGEYGTSKVGGYTLEGMLASRNGEILAQSNANRITALEATVVNNI